MTHLTVSAASMEAFAALSCKDDTKTESNTPHALEKKILTVNCLLPEPILLAVFSSSLPAFSYWNLVPEFF